MKKYTFITIIMTAFILASTISAFSMRFPVDVSIGYGNTYGGAGGRLTLGEFVTAGAGKFDGETMYSVGVQLPIFFSKEKKFRSTPYIGLSYGGVAIVDSWYGSDREKKVVNGFTAFGGFVWGWDFGLFLHVDLGYYWGETTVFEGKAYEKKIKSSDYALDLGIGYRFF